MELKQYNVRADKWAIALLIVPYGIETLMKKRMTCAVMLLIVPYGIET